MTNYKWNNKKVTIDGKEYDIRFKNIVTGGGYAVLNYGDHKIEYTTEISRHSKKYQIIHNYNNCDKRTITKKYDYIEYVPKKWRPIFKVLFDELMEISEDFYKRSVMR